MRTKSLFVMLAIAAMALAAAGSARGETYSSAVQAMSPLAFWDFEDAGSGNGATAAATVGSPTYDGTYNGGVTLGASAPGLGKAAYFANGSSTTFTDQARVVASNAGMPGGYPGSSAEDRTVVFWVKTTATGPLVDYGKPQWASDYAISVNGDGKAFLSTYGDAGLTSPTVINDGNWHFIAVTAQFNGDGNWSTAIANSFYVDGQHAGTTFASPTWTALGGNNGIGPGGNGGIAMGGSYGGGAGFNGALDGVAIFTAALTPVQIGYLSTLAIPEPSAIVMLVAGLIGLLAYAWRRRK